MRYIQCAVWAVMVLASVEAGEWPCAKVIAYDPANCSCDHTQDLTSEQMYIYCDGVNMSLTNTHFGGANIEVKITCEEPITSVSPTPSLHLPHVQELHLHECLQAEGPVSDTLVRLGIQSLGSLEFTSKLVPRDNTLVSGLLANLTGVGGVSLSGFGLTHIDPHLFGDQNTPDSSITHLYMSRNNISEIDHRVFNKLTQLESLHLPENQLSTLPDDIFQYNKKLKYLYLQNNRLEDISSELFKNLGALNTLSLSGNQIKQLTGEWIGLYELYYLDFSANQLTSLGAGEESVFRHLGNLHKLHLSHNKLTRVYPDLMTLYSIDQIYLDNNNIKTIEVGRWPEITRHRHHPEIHLHLWNNNITVINADLPKAEADYERREPKVTVHLGGNPLNCDCDLYSLIKAIREGTSLQIPYIRLKFTKYDPLECSSPPSMKSRLVNDLSLEELTCPIDDGCPVPCSCYYRPEGSITVVNCSGVGMEKLPESLPTHPKSSHTQLLMSNNQLRNFTYSADRWPNITHLHLSNTSLTNFTMSGGTGPLKDLDISHNQLTFLSDDTVRHLRSLDSLSLHNNPWRCWCQDWQLVTLAKSLQNATAPHHDQITCLDKRVMTNLSLYDTCPISAS